MCPLYRGVLISDDIKLYYCDLRNCPDISVFYFNSDIDLDIEVSLFQMLICMQKYTIGTSKTVLIREVSLYQMSPLREVPLQCTPV